MIERQIASPSPSPCCFDVTNGSKTASIGCTVMPGPPSAIEMRMASGATAFVVMYSGRWSGGLSAIASHALTIRLSSTCWSCTRSPCTSGMVGDSRVTTVTDR